ncbi:MAG: hypothetical protein K1Y02_01790 [Candidatus Hydrogenedentes bacterium]|nr:hypothetical protein [Candidatus Hydrogenedentota bacterium]
MRHNLNITRFPARAWRPAILSVVLCLFVLALADEMYDYMSVADELNRIGPDYARTRGKQALIDEYRNLIEAYPGYANNIQMEAQIALIHEWDLSEAGQPPNPVAAYETLTNVINTYPADHPYMKTVRRMAANRAIPIDPKVAQDMYVGLMEDYPEDNVLAAESLFSLGQIADRQGNRAEADKYYEQTMNFTPSGGENPETELQDIEAFKLNAAAVMLGTAIQRFDDPNERLRALEDFLREHAGFAERFGDLAKRIRETIEVQIQQQAEGAGIAAVPASATNSGADTEQAAVHRATHGASATGSGQGGQQEAADSFHTASAVGVSPGQASAGQGSGRLGGALMKAVQSVASSPGARVALPAILAVLVLGVVVLIRRRFT